MLKSGTSKIAKEQDILTNLLPNLENLSRSLPWRESEATFPKGGKSRTGIFMVVARV